MVITKRQETENIDFRFEWIDMLVQYIEKIQASAERSNTEPIDVGIDNKIALSNGGYECPFCGSRDVAESDKSCRSCFSMFNKETVRVKKERSLISNEALDRLSWLPFVSADERILSNQKIS